MKYKIIILIMFIITMSVIGAVSATKNVTEVISVEDVNNEIVCADDCQIITQDDENTVEYVNETLEINENQLIGRSSTSLENELSASVGSRSDLYNEIKNSNGELNLTRDYEFSGVDVSININKKITINGNGFSITLKHNTAAFKITANNVVLNNITFIDGASSSGTIEWVGSKGSMDGCTFVNCRGSAVNWYGDYGILNSCNFIDSITHYRINSSSKTCFSKEGAVYWVGNYGVLNNSNFSNCVVHFPRNYNLNYYGYGGAVYWVGNNGILSNFNMKNCSIEYPSDKTNTYSIYSYGGAVYWEGLNGLMINGNFFDCTANSISIGEAKTYSYGGAVYWNGSCGFVDNCSFFNCVAKSLIDYTFSSYKDVDRSFYSYSYGGALYWMGENGTLINSKFINCSCNSNFDSIYTGDYMYKPSMMSGYTTYYHYKNYRYGYAYGGSVYWEGDNARLLSCDFINSTADSSIGSHYRDQHQADYTRCSNFNYINSYGGAISINNNKGVFNNSNFINCYANSNYHISCNSYLYIKDFIYTYDGSFSSRGGAIYLNNSLINLNRCNFTANQVHLSSDVPFDIPRPWGYGGAIYWESNFGNISDCNFDKCSVKLESSKTDGAFTSEGGSIYWKGENGLVKGCNFTNSISTVITKSYSYPYAGAIHWYGKNGVLYDCNFVNCSVISSSSSSTAQTSSYGGAIYWSGINGEIFNNTFTNCSASSSSSRPNSEGGAIYWLGTSGILTNCIFNNCLVLSSNSTSGSRGGSVSWHGQDGILFNCSFLNSSSTSYSYTNSFSSSSGGAVYWYGKNGVLYDCNFVNCLAWYYGNSPSGGAIYWSGKYGEVYDCSFVNCFSRGVKVSSHSTGSNYGAMYLGGSGSVLHGCNFVNCSAGSNGMAVYYTGINGSLYDCSFVNCSSGGLSFGGENCLLYDCSFVNCSANSGGALVFGGKNSLLYDCSFVNCSANSNGGAISSGGGSIYYESQSNLDLTNKTIYNCSFVNCSANSGGAIYSGLINYIVHSCSFVNCSAKDSGGAIYWEGYVHRSFSQNPINGCNGTVYNCSFMYCSAEVNGGAVYWSGKNGKLYNCSFMYCSAGFNGSSIYWDNIGGYLDECNFNGDKNSYSAHCYVDKGALLDSKFTIEVNNNTVGDCKVLINILKTATGNITYYIYNNSNDILIKSFNISIAQDELYIPLNDLDYGNYLIIVEYMGDSIYNISSIKVNFSLRYNPKFIVDINPNIEAYDTLTINITLNDDITGKLYLKILNETYLENVQGGKISFVIPKIIGGHHNFNIEYLGNVKYNLIHYCDSIDVAFKKSYVNFNVTNINFNENLILNPSINSNALGSFNIYLNNKVFATFPVGQTYNLKNLDVGEYNITVEYAGDAYFAPSQKTLNFNVFKAKPSLILRSTELEVDSVVIEYSITPGVTGKVGVYLNETFIKNVQIGEKINLNDFKLLGFYTIKLVYDGDNHYLSCHNITNISIKTKDISNDVILNSLDENALGKSIVIQLPSDAKGTMTLTIGGKNYNFNVLEGLANIKVPELVNGKYYYTISYSGDNKYSSFIKTGSLNVNKILPTRLTSISISTVYNGNKYLVVTLKDSHGNVISGVLLLANINGVKTITTDANGQARLSTNGLSPKSYNVFIEFAGNTNYQKSSVTVKITVKKATPKITAKAKTFKKSVKTKKYSITLKNNLNKVMKNTKVTIKVNKKTYTAKTNSKGVATFKITKLTKKGTFKSIITYKGNKYYNKVTKKVNIKCK